MLARDEHYAKEREKLEKKKKKMSEITKEEIAEIKEVAIDTLNLLWGKEFVIGGVFSRKFFLENSEEIMAVYLKKLKEVVKDGGD